MADAPVVHIAENSAENIAYKLFNLIVPQERERSGGQLTRERALDLFAECLLAVREPAARLQGMHKLPSPGR